MKTSVIIPCYNAAKYLREALSSVYGQTVLPDEVFLIDDCSEDESIDIANEFDINVLRTEENSGHAAVRNIGIDAVSGDLIFWLDADDFWEPKHCETLLKLFEKDKSADVAFTAVRYIGAKQGIWDGSNSCKEQDKVYWECLRQTILPFISVATKTAAVRKVGGLDSSIRTAPDFDFWLRMSRSCKFVASSDITANYRWHDTQISSEPMKQLESVYKSRFKIIRQLVAEGNDSLSRSTMRFITDLWHEDLIKAWHMRDFYRLARLIDMGEKVIGSTEVSIKMKKRIKVPRIFIHLIDKFQKGLK